MATAYIKLGSYEVETVLLEKCLNAMANNHPILLAGVPGCGKIAFAQLLGKLRGGPFRAPHYTVSDYGATGSYTDNAGECGLANGGILLLDECHEFRRETMENIGDAYRSRYVVRGNQSVATEFLPILTTTSCPCGMLGHHSRECQCKGQREHAGRVNERLEHFPNTVRIVIASLPTEAGKRIEPPFADVRL